MAYYSSLQKYEAATGKTFTTNCPNIHRTGSVKGMVKLGFGQKMEIEYDMETTFTCSHREMLQLRMISSILYGKERKQWKNKLRNWLSLQENMVIPPEIC